MAKKEPFMFDIKVKNNPFANKYFLNSPLLGVRNMFEALKLVRLYQAQVGVKTGRLRASAKASTQIGGQKNDRVIGKVTVAGPSVVADEPYKGAPFYYGVYHEEGNKGKGRSKKRKYGRDGYNELRRAAHQMRGNP